MGALEDLQRAIEEDDGDESWADELPEADELPDEENQTQAIVIPTR